MGTLGYHLKQRLTLSSVRFVTHKGSSKKINTTTKHGPKVTRTALSSTMDRPWTPNHLKTTKFIQSKPIVEVKKGEEPPF
jgi:hypothetical protein